LVLTSFPLELAAFACLAACDPPKANPQSVSHTIEIRLGA
jgi:hypothetical protein